MIKKATILLIGLIFLVSTVQAGSPAIVRNDFMCPLLALTSDGLTMFWALEAKEVVKTKDKMTCKGILPADIPRPTETVHLDYASTHLYCGISSGGTLDWKEEITPSGHVTLTCKFKPDSTP